MTHGPESSATNRERDAAAVRSAIARLVRLSNLAIFVIVALGLACAAFVQTTRFFSDRQEIRGWLIGLRLIVPLAALAATAWITQRLLKAFTRRVGDIHLELADHLPLFVRCKTVSIALLTIAGLFASTCLLFSHRTMDVLLALLPIVLLVISRPTFFGLVGFAQTVESMREQAAQ